MTNVEWPWQYSFPPFFTIQPNIETRAKQLEAWKTLVLDYHKASQQAILDISEAERSPLFNNASIKRRLPSEGIILVLESLAKKGNAEPCDKSKSRWYIYWHTLSEWADIVYSWAQETGQVNSVCTLYEIINAPDQDFLLKYGDANRGGRRDIGCPRKRWMLEQAKKANP
ncbi:vacuolar protein sorting 25 isoform X2 [Lycorma delicatula]|uniref:vacuolar protein sorting 25 isoform X2 n=1 Tax=Lycorma delicatula TaxID=130591 RepID=UPI003F50FFE1